MTDMAVESKSSQDVHPAQNSRRVAKRYAAERRFKLIGMLAVGAAVGMLGLLLVTIVARGLPAFWATHVAIDVTFSQEEIDPQNTGDPEVIGNANYRTLVRESMQKIFPDATGRSDRRALLGLVSSNAPLELRALAMEDPGIIGTTRTVWVKTSDDVYTFVKGQISRDVPEEDRRVKDQEIAWIDQLEAEERLEVRFDVDFFTTGDSREPEQAGIWGAVVGSFFTLIVTLALSFPVGVLTATYLEEFAPKNKLTDFIEVNINNLAAVPSIVFGLLGLAVFLNFFGLPRSAPLVGGMVLALMTLPTIIIASRAALKAVPPSIREAALGVGASKLQVVTHHVVPLAMPGILTGTIIGMAQALGETAPLLMIGMVAFIVDVPGGITDAATVLPVQVYLWADSPERAFVAKTSAAIMVLLGFLILMNAIAVVLRKRFERRW
ncbi:MAG: phosphate ABC transporter permease PstA [Limibacillus sp.]